MDAFIALASIVTILFLLFYFLNKKSKNDREKVLKLIPDFHKDVDVIIDGKHWFGDNLSFLHASNPESSLYESHRVYRSEILCKSNSGNYILFFAAFVPDRNKSYMDLDPKTVSKEEAMNWSNSYYDFYCSEFGRPEVA